MSRKKVMGTLGIIGLVVVVVIIWALVPPESPSPEIIQYGYLPLASSASFFVAIENGFFEEQGLKVEPIKFETSNQALEALVTGRVDATSIVALEAALTLEANTPGQFKIIEMTAATDETRVHRIMVKPNSPIQKLADLQGKKIGTFPGSQMVIFLKLILGNYFDVEKEIDIIQLRPPLQPQALESGQVDALFTLEPTGTLLEARGIGRAISVNPLYEFIQKPFPTAVGVISTELAKENPKAVAKIEAALRASHEYMRTQPKEASLVLPKYTPIEATIAPHVGLYDYWALETTNKDAVQRLADLYLEKGILDKHIFTSTLYADSL